MLLETFEMLSDVSLYLKRLSLEPPTTCDAAYLQRLIERHQQCIPFENIDIYDYNLPVAESIESVYEKVILRHRGGYCYELNMLFGALLRTLGYTAWPSLCRVINGRNELRHIGHRGTIVFLPDEQGQQRRAFCDVGFGGDMFPDAIYFPVEGTISSPQTRNGLTFWLEQECEGWWNLKHMTRRFKDSDNILSESQIETLLMVCSVPAAPVDFTFFNLNAYGSPDSGFKKNRILQICTTNGYLSLRGNTFTIVNGCTKEVSIVDKIEQQRLLRDVFLIDLDDLSM